MNATLCIAQPKNILMITYVFPPIAYAGTYRSLRFCRYLPESNWNPIILTIKEAADLDLDYGLMDRIPPGIRIYRTPTFDPWRFRNFRYKKIKPGKIYAADLNKCQSFPEKKERQNVIRRFASHLKKFAWEMVTIPDHMIFWVFFAFVRGIFLINRESIDVIYTSSPPHSEHLVGLLLSKLFRKPWVADFRDPMLDSSGYKPVSHLRARVDITLEKLIATHADKVLIISEHYKKNIARRYPQYRRKFITFPNGYDPEVYERAQPETFQKFTILYAGSFYANRNPAFFLHGFAGWLRSKPQHARDEIQVVFYGPPSLIAQTIVDEEGLQDHVFFKGMIPQDELVPKQKGAHLLLLIIGFDAESRGTITSKVFEYMACRNPILAIIPHGDAMDILKKYPKLYPVDREDTDMLQLRLDQAYTLFKKSSNSLLTSPETETTENNSEDFYNVCNQTRTLASIFSSLTS